MREEGRTPEKIKAPILLASFGISLQLEPIIAALRTKEELPSWESLTADLILEASRLSPFKCNRTQYHNKNKKSIEQGFTGLHKANCASRPNMKTRKDLSFDFCGKSGNVAPDCFDNLESPKFCLTNTAEKNMTRALKKTKHIFWEWKANKIRWNGQA
eukprot:IDg2367t1